MPEVIGPGRADQPDARLACLVDLNHLAVGERESAEGDPRRGAVAVRKHLEAVPGRIDGHARYRRRWLRAWDDGDYLLGRDDRIDAVVAAPRHDIRPDGEL